MNKSVGQMVQGEALPRTSTGLSPCVMERTINKAVGLESIKQGLHEKNISNLDFVLCNK